jgi:hypothetical protein
MEQLEKHHLTGEAFAETVLHLNSCLECRQKLSLPNKEEILKFLFEEEASALNVKNEDDILPEETEKPGQQSWWKKVNSFFRKGDK